MPIKRAVVTVRVACNRRDYPPGTYRCGLLKPEYYVIEANNPVGTEIFDTRTETKTIEMPDDVIITVSCDPFDATHVGLGCQCNTDSEYGEVEVRIISLYET